MIMASPSSKRTSLQISTFGRSSKRSGEPGSGRSGGTGCPNSRTACGSHGPWRMIRFDSRRSSAPASSLSRPRWVRPISWITPRDLATNSSSTSSAKSRATRTLELAADGPRQPRQDANLDSHSGEGVPVEERDISATAEASPETSPPCSGAMAPSVDSIRSGRPCLGDRTVAVGSDLEWDVEEIVVILDRVHPRDLGDLLLAEVLPELLERCVRDSPVLGGLLRIRQRRSLPSGEERAGPVFGQRVELLHPEVLPDRHGPPEVHAELAAVDLGSEETHHVMEGRLEPDPM